MQNQAFKLRRADSNCFSVKSKCASHTRQLLHGVFYNCQHVNQIQNTEFIKISEKLQALMDQGIWKLQDRFRLNRRASDRLNVIFSHKHVGRPCFSLLHISPHSPDHHLTGVRKLWRLVTFLLSIVQKEEDILICVCAAGNKAKPLYQTRDKMCRSIAETLFKINLLTLQKVCKHIRQQSMLELSLPLFYNNIIAHLHKTDTLQFPPTIG